jgi:bacteriocin-like protein
MQDNQKLVDDQNAQQGEAKKEELSQEELAKVTGGSSTQGSGAGKVTF